jgi:uncharacterized protein
MEKNQRCCLSCRRIAAKSDLLRVVRCHPSRSVTIDDGTVHLQGRSAYLCPNPECIAIAQKKNRLSRALKAPIDPQIYSIIKEKSVDMLFPT